MNVDSVDIFTQFATDLQTATQGVPGFVADQVIIGHIEFVVCEEFYKEVADGGFFLLIGLPNGSGNYFKSEGTFFVTAELFYPIPADRTFNFFSVNKMIAAMIDGWAHYTQPSNSQWVKGQNRSPLKYRFDKPIIRPNIKPCGKFLGEESFIASTRFTFEMPFITDQTSNPIEQPSA